MAIRIREDNLNFGILQSGFGKPIHIAPTGSLFVDKSTAIPYINKNGSSNWAEIFDDYSVVGDLPSTGVITFGGIHKTSNTTFSVSAATGWIVDNVTNPYQPTQTYVTFSGATNLDSPYRTTATITYILLGINGTLSYQPYPPTPVQRRENIYLGKIGHPDKNNFSIAFQVTDHVQSPVSQLRDMFTPIPLINAGISVYANTGLTLSSTAGILYGLGISFPSSPSNPNTISVAAQIPVTFQYRTQTGGTLGNTTLVDPLYYDVGGVITAIGSPAKQATNQRVFILQDGSFRIQYGQHKYSDLAAAVVAIPTESFVTFSNWRDNGILIGILSMESDVVDLTATTKAAFTTVSKFGEATGSASASGGGTATLQTAYNNSTTPEITTNSSLNALTIRRGSASDSDNLIEFQNGAGGTVSTISASGLATFNSVLVDTTFISSGTTKLANSGFNRVLIGATPLVGTYSGGTIPDGLTINSQSAGGISFLRPTDFAQMVALTCVDTGTLRVGGGNQNAIDIYGHTTFISRFINTGGGRLGILTLNPAVTLDVSGDTRIVSGLTANTVVVNTLTSKVSDNFLVTADSNGLLNKLTGNTANRVPYFNASSAITTDSNFTYDGNGTLTLNNTTTSQLIFDGSRGGIACNGGPSVNLTFEMSFGQTGAPDTSKGFLFRNKQSNNYLLLNSPSATQHLATFYGTVSVAPTTSVVRSYWGTSGLGLQVASATYGDSSSSSSAGNLAINSFAIPTITASTATTYAALSTVYIDGPPTLGTNVSGTSYALYINSGDTLFSGNTKITNGLTASTISATTYLNYPRIYWYAEPSYLPSVLPISTSGGIAIGNNAESLSIYTLSFGDYAGKNAVSTDVSNFIGFGAGFNVTGSTYSNYIGYNTGRDATGNTNTIFIGYEAGKGSIDNLNCDFIGSSAGLGALSAESVFFAGLQAGYYSNTAVNVVGIGQQAGAESVNAGPAVFLSDNAGAFSTGSSVNVSIGLQAGYSGFNQGQAVNLGASAGWRGRNLLYTNYIGTNAGRNADDVTDSSFIGRSAGLGATATTTGNYIGLEAGRNASSVTGSNFIGYRAGHTATGSSYSNFIGYDAGYLTNDASYSNFIGLEAGTLADNATGSTFIGYQAGKRSTGGTASVILGYKAGASTSVGVSYGSNNIIIGTNITLSSGTKNSINIGGVLFGTNTYSAITGDSVSRPNNGKIGINVVTPSEAFHVVGNGKIDGNLTVTGTTSSNIISAQTYQNVNAVTGGTYNSVTGTITLSGTGNVNGNTITGFSTGGGGTGISWSAITTTQAAIVNYGFVATAASLTTITLPVTAAFGSVIEAVATGTGGFTIAQNSGQVIHFGLVDSTTGVGGSVSSQNRYDTIRLLCTVADTEFTVLSSVGNFTIN